MENKPDAALLQAVTLRLPPFSTTDVLVWFRRAETQFRLKHINQTTTKADYVLESLSDSVFTRIAPWLNDQPDQLDYATLKQHLLKVYSPTTSERARRILAMPNQPLGDRKPRQVWDEINTLCRLPDTDPITGKHKEVDLKKEIWLQSLPDYVRRLLHDVDLPIDDLITKADALLEAHRSSQLAPPNFAAATSPTDIGSDDIFAARQHPSRRRIEYSNKPLSVITESGLCGYHRQFGAKARSCVPGCQWKPKNAIAGR